MAVEVLTNQYERQDVDLLMRLTEVEAERLENIHFLHNYLHDIEGVWWIAIWSLFNTVPANRVTEVVTSLTELSPQEKLAHTIFSDRHLCSSACRTFWSNAASRRKDMKTLPKEYDGVKMQMQAAMKDLFDVYRRVEDVCNPEIAYDKSAFEDIYGKLIPAFEKAQEGASENVVFLQDYRRSVQVAKKEKREAEEKKNKAAAQEQQSSTRASKRKTNKRKRDENNDEAEDAVSAASRSRTSSTTSSKRQKALPRVPRAQRPLVRRRVS